MENKLTKIQEKTLNFIKTYSQKKGEKPTTSKIAKHFGITSGAAWCRVDWLKNKKLI